VAQNVEKTFAMLELDHIVLAAFSLEEGLAYAEEALGLSVPPGGKHAFMGTHNHLLKLSGGSYLEVIAIDSDAPAPPRSRWFNLDDGAFRNSLIGNPRIVHWLLKTRTIETMVQAVPYATQAIINGKRGDLTWKITISPDGAMPFDGAFPSFIEWPEGPHVSERMDEKGCSLSRFTVKHPQAETIRRSLTPYFTDGRVHFEPSEHIAFAAVIETPRGTVTLG
jgi:hypothetical protein